MEHKRVWQAGPESPLCRLLASDCRPGALARGTGLVGGGRAVSWEVASVFVIFCLDKNQ